MRFLAWVSSVSWCLMEERGMFDETDPGVDAHW